MRFRSHQCWFPKDVDFPRDYEDASARSEKHGRAVIADGVSSAIFSRNWARMLTRAAVEEPPLLDSDEAIRDWLEPRQQAWRQDIDFDALKWHQKPKATSVGAQSTFLIVHVNPLPEDESSSGEYQLRASALGDCVLYLVREGRKLLSFPLAESAGFASSPHIFSSIAKGVAYADKFEHLDGRCRHGDLLVLCSDAVGLWAMEEYEAGRDVDWMRYWDNDLAWQEDIRRLRAIRPGDGNRMRVDDCTLLLLQVVAEEIVAGEPEVQPDRSDERFVIAGMDAEESFPPIAEPALATGSLPSDSNAVATRNDAHHARSTDTVDTDCGAFGDANEQVAANEQLPAEAAPTEPVVGGLAEGINAPASPEDHAAAVDSPDRSPAHDEALTKPWGFLRRMRRLMAGADAPHGDNK